MILKTLFWFPRILAILVILFLMMFSLDVFEGDESLGRKLVGLVVHNIPAFALIVVLIIAWKHEITGGVLFILLSIIFSLIFKSFSGNSGSLIILTPVLITGALFILHHFLAERSKH